MVGVKEVVEEIKKIGEEYGIENNKGDEEDRGGTEKRKDN